jgi:plasmid replication initiation protein
MDDKVHGAELDVFKPKEKNYHSNWLVDSRHEFSLLEKKMIYCIINQLDVTINVQQDLFGDMYFKIPVNVFGADYNFTALRTAINKIVTRSITGSNEAKKYAFAIAPIPWAELKNGVIQLKLQKEAVPYFIDLKRRGYTTYELDVAMSLSSVYSQRLFELLSRWKDTGKWYGVEIEKFKFLMGVDKDKAYNGTVANGNLKSRILEPARLELAEKTDIEFTYAFEKEGRKFVSINFDIFTKTLIKHLETADAKEDTKTLLSQLADATQGQQTIFIEQAFADYQFTEIQKNKIRQDNKFKLKFIEIHTSIMTKAIEVQTTPIRLMAWHLRKLGWY